MAAGLFTGTRRRRVCGSEIVSRPCRFFTARAIDENNRRLKSFPSVSSRSVFFMPYSITVKIHSQASCELPRFLSKRNLIEQLVVHAGHEWAGDKPATRPAKGKRDTNHE